MLKESKKKYYYFLDFSYFYTPASQILQSSTWPTFWWLLTHEIQSCNMYKSNKLTPVLDSTLILHDPLYKYVYL